jgi:hypothetical protein
MEHDLDQELHTHIENRADDLERSGIPRTEAERRACREFGGYQKFKEECRDALGTHLVEALLQDVRYGLRLPERRWLFVPLWGIPTYFLYAPRRVECAEHGVVVEHIPWSDGKRPVTCAMMGFLARWAGTLSWRETAQVFQTSWEAVFRSVEWFVEWGLAHWKLQKVESIGVDEIHWGPRLARRQFPDRHLPDRCALPAPVVGRQTALGGDPATRAEGAGP